MNTDNKRTMNYKGNNFHDVIDDCFPSMAKELQDRILNSCIEAVPYSAAEKKPDSRKRHRFHLAGRLGYAAIFLLVITLGTVFAAGYQNVLSQFFFKEELPYLKPDSASYLLTDSHDSISLSIDAFLPKENGYTLIASLIREDGQPWDERSGYRNMVSVSIRDLPEDAGSFGIIRPGELSEDGSRLTFLLESYEDVTVSDHEITVAINDIVLTKQAEEREIFIPLTVLYNESGASLQARAEDRTSTNSQQTLYDKINTKQSTVLSDDYPDVILKGAGYLENYDNQYEEGLLPFFRGMYLYTENLSDILETHVARRGFVSEIVNIETGEVQEIWMESSYHPQNDAESPSIGLSVFEDITPDDLALYAATKVTYYEEECVEGRWEIRFTPEEKQDQKTGLYRQHKTVIYDSQEVEAIFEAEFHVSSLGVMVKNRLLSLSGEVLDSFNTDYSYGNLSVTMHHKDGSVTKLHFDGAFSLRQEPGTMLSEYIAYDGTHRWDERHVFNLDEIDCLTVNGERVELREND